MTSLFSKTKGSFCFSFNKRFPKGVLGKLSFLHMLFLEKEAQISKNSYGKMLFMSKQVSLPKISSILQKNENWPKRRYTPFLHEILQFELWMTG